MPILNYCCINQNCNAQMFSISSNTDNPKKRVFCENCGKSLKLVGIKMSGGYTKFQSLSLAEKKKMLVQRSHEHFMRDGDGARTKKHEVNKQLKREAIEILGRKRKKIY